MIIAPIAYMDPGTGSLFLQLLLGGVAGALVVIKLFWHKILSFFGANQEPEPEESGNQFEVPNPNLEGNTKS